MVTDLLLQTNIMLQVETFHLTQWNQRRLISIFGGTSLKVKVQTVEQLCAKERFKFKLLSATWYYGNYEKISPYDIFSYPTDQQTIHYLIVP